MSEQDTQDESSSAQPESAGQDNDLQSSEAADSAPRRTGGGVLSGLTLIVALGALGLAAWVWLQLDAGSEDDRIDEVQAALSGERERTGQIEETLQSLTSSVDELNQAIRDRDEQMGELEGALDSVGNEVSRVEQRVDEVESEILDQVHQLWQREDTQREVDRELDRYLAMIETAALLRLGQERAELAHDFSGARSAYRRAAAVLASADDPRLSQVRRLLAAELDALEAVQTPDWLEAQARLERLGRQVGEWPLARHETGLDQAADEVDPAESGWAATMRSALGELVRVRPRDEAPISPEQLEMIRENLRLRLAAAELALGRRDLTELDHHLRRAAETLNSHFDNEASVIQDALEVIDRLRGLEPATAPSSLGEALARLRENMESS